jgi:protein phosphatase PTC4
MGQLMSHPIEDKNVECHSHESLTYSIGSMQGYRMSMEDAHCVKIDEHEKVGVFGVFDGHGGKECADVVCERLPLMIFRQILALLDDKNVVGATVNDTSDAKTEKNGASTEENGTKHDGKAAAMALKEARLGNLRSSAMDIIRNCFFRVDHELEAYHDAANCGTTAIVATVLAGKYVIVANTGDSRCIMSVNGAAKTLSFDHKPSTMGERVRIENSGGYVVCGRVNEVLALSRAFGDFKFKTPYVDGDTNQIYARNKKYWKNGMVYLPPELLLVLVEPDILVYDLAKLTAPEFMVLACDGIWDCYTNDQLLKAIRSKLAELWNLRHITEYILNECISMASSATGIGFDNMTLVIVALHPTETIDEWYHRMKSPAAF